MHLITPIFLSLLTSTALALPTTTSVFSNSTSTLAKRWGTKGWVGAFQNPSCSGEPAPGKAPLEDECVKWSPVGETSHVGINFGTMLEHVYEVTFYADDKCTNVLNDQSFVNQPGKKDGFGCTPSVQKAKSFKVQGDIAGLDDKIGKSG